MSENDEMYVLKRRMRNLRLRLRRYGSAYTRVVTSAFGREHVLPDFLVIGAMKCASSGSGTCS